MAEAEARYRDILRMEPKHPQALHYLGVCALQRNQGASAIELIGYAAMLAPHDPAIHANLGEAFRRIGRPKDAVRSLRRALILRPIYPEALANLGNALLAADHIEEALACLRQAAALQPDPTAFYNLALALRQHAEPEEAVQCLERAIELNPKFPAALNALGVLLREQGKREEAQRRFAQAVTLAPAFAAAQSNLGGVLRELGRPKEALVALLEALRADPRLPDAYNNLGNLYRDEGQFDQASAALRQAVNLRPEFLEAHNNLGNVLRELGHLAEAASCFQRALAIDPLRAETYNNLGTVLKDRGELEAAHAAFRQALAINGQFPAAHNNFGTVLRAKGCLREAKDAFQQAIALQPAFPAAHVNLGNVYRDLGMARDAAEAYRRALVLRPDLDVAHNNLGTILRDQGQLDAALQAYEKALALNPMLVDALNNLGNLKKDQGDLDAALACYRKALAIQPDFQVAHSNLLYTLLFHPGYSAKAIDHAHRDWATRYATPLLQAQAPASPFSRSRLRIGYVSPDFRDHVVGRNILPLFQHHDRTRFDIVAYADLAKPDRFTAQFQELSSTWRTITGLSDTQVANLVRSDGIDILVDLTLHMGGNRLLAFALKPAPVQATFAGYPGTTGLSVIDYRLTDHYLDPPEEPADNYAEKSLRFADSFWCYAPTGDEPPVNSLPALKNEFITFGCLNNFCKVTRASVQLWSKVLSAIPNSLLLLLTTEGEHRERTRRIFDAHGVTGNRIRFASPRSRVQYLELYHQIDIGLDTLPYNGHTTSLDSFWMGVPVVTLVGETVVGRAGYSQLSNLGLKALAAFTPTDYVDIVANLSQNLPELDQLRSSLRARMQNSVLSDAPRFAQAVETAYQEMWRQSIAR